MANGSNGGKGKGSKRSTGTAAMNRAPQRGGGLRFTPVAQGNTPF